MTDAMVRVEAVALSRPEPSPGTLSFLSVAPVEASDVILHLQPAAHQRFTDAIQPVNARAASDVSQIARALVARFGASSTAPVGQDESTVLELPVHRHVVQAAGRELSEGVSRIGLVRRRSDLTHAEFVQHYLDNHVPLVMEHGPLFDAYSVNIVDDSECEWDAVVWQTFDSFSTWAEHDRQVMENKPEVRADLARFVGELVSFEGRFPRSKAYSGALADIPSTTREGKR